MFKKILIVFGILIILFIGALIAVPIIFKDDIIAEINKAKDDYVDADASIGNLSLSLIKSFPDFYLEINDILVINKAPFEGDTLLYLKQLNVDIDLMSAINGETYKINAVNLIDPIIGVTVLKNGKASYDIAKSTGDTTEVEESEEEETAESSPMKFKLKRFSIQRANIRYEDESMDAFAYIKDLNYTLSGDFDLEQFDLMNVLEIASLSAEFEGVPYLKKVQIKLTADLQMDMKNQKYTFKKNEFVLNTLKLGFDGYVALPNEEDIEMDIKFNTNEPSFKELLMLVPAAYTADFADVQADGKLALAGFAKGTYSEDMLPGFGIDLKVTDANVKYPDLPVPVNNINIDLKIDNPDGVEDHTIVNLSKFHLELDKEPFDMKLYSKTPISDPYVDMSVNGKIDLDRLKKAMPMEEIKELSGIITTNMAAKGHYSTIEKEAYEDFDARGNITLQNIKYSSEDLPHPLNMSGLSLTFNPKNAVLDHMDVKIGSSDIHMDGTLENFIDYALNDGTIKGLVNLSSTNFDANEWLEEEEVSETTQATDQDEEPLEVVEIPSNIDFVMNTNMKRVLYDNMEINNIQGNITVKEAIAKLNNVKMDMLGGNIGMSGTYGTQNIEVPDFDFYLDVKNIEIQKTAQTFNSVEKLAPVAKNSEGIVSTQMKVKGILNQEMMPVYDSMNGEGEMQVRDLVVQGLPITDKIGDALKYEDIKRLKTDDVDIRFEIKDGRVYVEPFHIQMGDIDMQVEGSNGIDETIDYKINADIPNKLLGGGANQLAQGLLNQIGTAGVEANVGDKINMDILVGGTYTNPTVTLGAKDLVKEAAQDVKEQVKEVVKEKVEEVKTQVKDEINKQKAEAEAKARAEAQKQADKIIAEAEKQAKAIRTNGKAAADQIRSEGEKQAKAIEAKSTKPWEKAAAKVAAEKVRKETQTKASQTEQEANKKADKLVTDAKKKANDLLTKY